MESSKKNKVSKQYPPKIDSNDSFVYTSLRNDSRLYKAASPDRKMNEELKCINLFGLIANEVSS